MRAMDPRSAGRTSRILGALEVPVLLAVPAVLLVCAALRVNQSALVTLVVVVAAIAVMLGSWEASRPGLRQVMPAAVLGALAAAGRIVFAAVPDVKPVSAICILAGVTFGRRTGFVVGAVAALVSNFVLGQGVWTAWQMYAWGMVGYISGVLASRGLMDKTWVVCTWGFASALLYGLVLNTWFVVGFVRPLTCVTVLAAYAAGVGLDLVHGVSTVAFLLVIYAPWRRKLERIRSKYDLM